MRRVVVCALALALISIGGVGGASARATIIVSLGNTQQAGDGPSGGPELLPSVTSDGRSIAFTSTATNFAPLRDTNGGQDIFVRDLLARTTIPVSVAMAPNLRTGNRPSGRASIAGFGRFVAFDSLASDLVPDDLNGESDVFVRDLVADSTVRISVSTTGADAAGTSSRPSISADGRYVAFQSSASDLVPLDTNDEVDIFVRDRDTDGNGVLDEPGSATVRVSISATDEEGDAPSLAPVISADGSTVAFYSHATNLVRADTNSVSDVFVRRISDRATIERASVGQLGAQGNGFSQLPAIAADGSRVAFESRASNLVSDDSNGVFDVFVRDLSAATTERVSVTDNGQQTDGPSAGAALSGDGDRIAFVSTARNLVIDPTCANCQNVYLRDLASRRTTIESKGIGQAATRSSFSPALSLDGRSIVFPSDAPNLIEGDSNGETDVFARTYELMCQGIDAERGAVTGEIHRSVEPAAGPAEPLIHDMSCSLAAAGG